MIQEDINNLLDYYKDSLYDVYVKIKRDNFNREYEFHVVPCKITKEVIMKDPILRQEFDKYNLLVSKDGEVTKITVAPDEIVSITVNKVLLDITPEPDKTFEVPDDLQ